MRSRQKLRWLILRRRSQIEAFTLKMCCVEWDNHYWPGEQK